MNQFQEIIPPHYHGIYVPDEKALSNLGNNNLGFLKQYWRRREREIVYSIKEIQNYIDLMSGKTVNDIRLMAAEYENPVFSKIGTPHQPDKPEPLEAKALCLTPGATTFNVCGWCKYAKGISRNGCYTMAKCKLCPNLKGYFNTPCIFLNNSDCIETSVEYLKTDLTKLKEEKKRVARYISIITEASKQADKKPPFPWFRTFDWFKEGDNVIYLKDGVFSTGKVVNTYSYEIGEIQILDKPHYRYVKYGINRPEIMHTWECGFLSTHHAYLEIWLKSAADLPDFEMYRMSRAFGL